MIYIYIYREREREIKTLGLLWARVDVIDVEIATKTRKGIGISDPNPRD